MQINPSRSNFTMDSYYIPNADAQWEDLLTITFTMDSYDIPNPFNTNFDNDPVELNYYNNGHQTGVTTNE